MYEVENKFRVERFEPIIGKLRALGLQIDQQGELRQVDVYFAHPSRDFRQTDEVLRIRSVGQANITPAS